MNCQTCRTEIEEANLDERLSDEAHAHLKGCANCHVFNDERRTLKHLVSGLETVSAPADFEFHLRMRLAAAKEKVKPRYIRLSFASSTLSIMLAACFALTVAVALHLQRLRLVNPDAPKMSEHAGTMLSPYPAPPLNGEVKRDAYYSRADISNTTNTGKLNVTMSRRPHMLPIRAIKRLDNVVRRMNNLVDSTSLGVSGAPVIRSLAAQSNTEAEPDIATTSPVSSSPMKLLLQDAQGEVSVPRVEERAAGKETEEGGAEAQAYVAEAEARAREASAAHSGLAIRPLTAVGLEAITLSSELATQYGVQDGLLVLAVRPQSSAAASGVRVGDVIESVNGQSVSGAEWARNFSLPDNYNLSLGIVRGRQKLTLTLPHRNSVK